MNVRNLKRKIQVACAVMLMLALSACGSYVNVAFNKKAYEQGNTAYVVVGATNNHQPVNEKRTVYSYICLKNKQNGEIILKVAGLQSFIIPPGDYTLTSFKLGDFIEGSSLATWVDIKDRIEGNFTVSAGDAVYLGEVNTLVTKNVSRALIWKEYADSEVEFTSIITNNFSILDVKKFEAECGKTITPRIMTWNKLR